MTNPIDRKKNTSWFQDATGTGKPGALGDKGVDICKKWCKDHGIGFKEGDKKYHKYKGDGGFDIIIDGVKVDVKLTRIPSKELMVRDGKVEAEWYCLVYDGKVIGWASFEQVYNSECYKKYKFKSHIVEFKDLKTDEEFLEYIRNSS